MQMGLLFKGYLSALAAMGRAIGRSPEQAHCIHPVVQIGTAGSAKANDHAAMTLAETDRRATAAGNHYRALGIAIGLLGIVIVFLAIAPVGLDLGEHTAHLLGGLKVFLMVAMLLLVWFGRRGHTHRDWISLRARAEELRYAPLAALIERSETTPDEASMKALETELVQILAGPKGQIAYNEGKAQQYHAIERFSDFLLWASVLLALVGAGGHLVAGWSWWIFLTAFGPAAVGGVHGINGFLGVGSLVEEHETTRKLLAERLAHLHELRNSQERSEGLPKLAKSMLGILTSRDIRWKESAEKLGLRPA